jgi:hypothetical protein
LAAVAVVQPNVDTFVQVLLAVVWKMKPVWQAAQVAEFEAQFPHPVTEQVAQP